MIYKENNVETLNVLEQYENFFMGITDLEFKQMHREEIIEMLAHIKAALKSKANPCNPQKTL
jgi:hypothetical protein